VTGFFTIGKIVMDPNQKIYNYDVYIEYLYIVFIVILYMSSKKDSLSKKKDAFSLVKELYSATDYMSKYGTDVWITAIVCTTVVYLMTHQYIVNILEVIRADWPNLKCEPLLLPFAGFINKPVGVSNFLFTSDNFNTCVYEILKHITEIAVSPLQMVLTLINKAVSEIVNGVNAIRSLFDSLRCLFTDIFGRFYAIIANLTVEFIHFIVKIKDLSAKAAGVLVNALFILFGSFMAMQSLFLSLLDLMTIIMIAIVCVIVVLIYIAVVHHMMLPIPIVGAAAAPIATAFTIKSIIGVLILIGILIPVVMFMVFMMRVLNLSSPPPPQVPGCFAGDTVIPLFQGGVKKIQDIDIGDQLQNGGVVTATIQFAAADQNIYTLNGVFVTGEHRVFHPLLKWIKVKNHPDSVYNPDFIEPYVYCLNTTDKVFIIGETLFSDWDDIDETVIQSLQKNCVAYGFLPDGFNYKDIHTYLDSGFHSTTKVKLQNGLSVPICDIKVNDVLDDGANVMGANVVGIIKIAGHDITQYKHTFINNSVICGTKNIHTDDVNLGIINCMNSENVHSEPMQSEPMQSEPILYHLLTDKKYFIANNIKVNDYNYGIDAYLKYH